MKKNRKNRLLCILLSLAMVLTLLPGMSLTAYADTGEYLLEDDYLTFTAEENDSSVTVKWNKGSNVKFKKNNDNWSSCNKGDSITLNKGDKVRFRGNKITFNSTYHFSITGKVAGSGSVMSLRLDEDSKEQDMANYCFSYMFKGCTGLTKSPDLPAKNLANYCYSNMFEDCTELTEAPDLPATVLPSGCYFAMFLGCKGIMLSETKTDEYWYEYKITAESAANGALNKMFDRTGGDFTGTPEVNKTYYMKTTRTITNVTGITLDKTNAQNILVDGTVAFTATISPDNATDQLVQWTSSDASVELYSDESCTTEVGTDATETMTVYAKGVSAGTATVTATSNADNTKTASCTVNVIDPKLPDGKYAQTATVENVDYTRYVYVVPASAIENAKSATFTVSNGTASRTFDTSTYYTGVTCNGILYEPESTESVMLVCTVKGGLPESEGGNLTCRLSIDGVEYPPAE